MTDLDKLKGLLSEFGVEYTSVEALGVISIACSQGSVKVSGYVEFYTAFEFTSEGEFILMGAWE